jgi:putative transcriptional regulator
MSYYDNEGKILIATPSVTNNLFRKSVIYIHTDDSVGAMGIMLNIPMETSIAANFASEIDWNYPDQIRHGGPIDQQLGYVIHSTDYGCSTSINLNTDIGYTVGRHVITDINAGYGPSDFMLVTGYCQWQPQQLDTEIENEMWTIAEFDTNFFFQGKTRDAEWIDAVNIAASQQASLLLD